MKVIYYDGSILMGSIVEFYDNCLIVDGIYNVPIIEVLRIEE